MSLRIIDICNDEGRITEAAWLTKAEAVHRQLRPNLPAAYAERLARVFADGGRMSVAVDDDAVRGVAVWRCYEDTYNGTKFYVDDLVSDAAHRSRGVGQRLIGHLADKARARGADNLVLDSGVQRHGAHKFYFREGFAITSHNFKKPLV
ncbi:MAG: GNAT family N-acetyltransferase [Rhodocyclaceae bacterium]